MRLNFPVGFFTSSGAMSLMTGEFAPMLPVHQEAQNVSLLPFEITIFLFGIFGIFGIPGRFGITGPIG